MQPLTLTVMIKMTTIVIARQKPEHIERLLKKKKFQMAFYNLY